VSAPVDWVPLKDLAPDQAPVAVQEVALVDDQVKVAALPLATVLGLALKLTVALGCELTVTVADCAALPPAPVHVNVYVALAVRVPVDCEPLTGLLPDHAPDAEQEVALVADQFNVALLPLVIALGPTLRITLGAGDFTVTVAVCAALPPGPVQVNVYIALAVSSLVDCEPLIGLLPDHAPEAEHDVAFAADQFNVELVPLVIVLGLALRLTEGAVGATETVAD
jgi:hypothetical protein